MEKFIDIAAVILVGLGLFAAGVVILGFFAFYLVVLAPFALVVWGIVEIVKAVRGVPTAGEQK